MNTRVHLIRHGVTDSNRERRYMGRSQESLANDGRWQARQLAQRMVGFNLDAVYCSPLRRAQETAATIAQPHALRPQPVADFVELDLSRWEGMTPPEIAAQDPEEWSLWCAEPSRLRLPGIEGFPELQARVRRGLDAIVRRHAGGDVAVITHDGIVRIAVLEAVGIPVDRYRAIPVDNTSLTTLDFADERTYLRALNDTGHLGDASVDAVAGPADR